MAKTHAQASKYLMLFVIMTSFVPSAASGADAEDPAEIEIELKEFFDKKVHVAGFVDNLVGLMTAPGDELFSSSNRMVKQRFTISPEINIDFSDKVKLFASWRWVKEIRYNKEAKDRANRPLSLGGPLPPDDNRFYDEDSPVPREIVLDVLPTDRLTLRFGRQFISWGETDGLRLLDVINPQNFTFTTPAAPNLFPLDETRIANWGVRILYNVRPVTNTTAEFFYFPGIDTSDNSVDDTFAASSLRLWVAHPETRLPFGRLFANPLGPVPVVIPEVTRVKPVTGQNWKIGARITHNFGALNVGLGYIYGYNPQSTDMVFKVTSVECAEPVAPGAPCLAPTVAKLDLINDQTSIFAAQFNYPVGSIGKIPVKTAIRGEVAFYPGEPYNISDFPGPDGLIAGPDPDYPDGIIKRNTLRWSMGFDRSTFIPFLQEDPWRPFRMSFQIFQRIILGHRDGIRVFSTASKINTVSTSLTFRVSTGYLGDTVLPDIFVAYDPDGYWAVNPAVSYVPPGNERIKLSLIGTIYGGRDQFKSFGFFREKSSIFLRMRYQFGQ